MARLRAFQLIGYELWINTNDHAPPHFHLTDHAETFELRIHFLEVLPGHLSASVVFPKAARSSSCLRGAKRAELIELVLQHREELLAEWTKFHPS
jgi:hypothetical protein